VALTRSICYCLAKAWPAWFTVAGLRRCLIIFAPRTLILDRRTCTCRTPSLPWISQRSKNFTSGAPISFTLNSPIGCDRWVQATRAVEGPIPSRNGRGRTGGRTNSPEGPREHPPGCPEWAPRPAQLQCHTRSIPRRSMDGHSANQEDALSTLSFPGCHRRWAPVVDWGVCRGAEAGPPWRPSPVREA
jgi:hypothetical protein